MVPGTTSEMIEQRKRKSDFYRMAICTINPTVRGMAILS
jgi:hypothetical protein